MEKILSVAACAAFLLGGASLAQAEFPTFEIMGFPITAHQILTADSAQLKERSPTSTLTLHGMPASPHQIALMTPRIRMTEQQVADKLTKDGFLRLQVELPTEYTFFGYRGGELIKVTVDSRTGKLHWPPR
jgi:hypothetical protein